MFTPLLAIALTVMPVAPRQEPTFTPYTVKPQLLNRNDVAQALVRNYPSELRDKGVGGTTLLWILLGKDGWPKDVRIRTSSGYAALDSGAVKVGTIMHFTPAQNHDKPVDVWIQLPIVFQVNSRAKRQL